MTDARIYLLYGTDRYTRDEQVRGLKRRMLDEPSGDFNLTELSGADVTLTDVRAAADTMPFLAERRMVVVEGMVGRLSGQKPAARRGRGARKAEARPEAGELQALIDYLPLVPPTTALVLVEDQLDASSIEAAIPSDRAYVRGYTRPRGADLQRWIERRVRHHGGAIQAAAVRRLGLLPSDDLGLIDNEIRKLVTYCDDRPVTTDDVDLLASSPDVTVFALIDAMAEQRRGLALIHLRRLVDRGERPEAVVAQIASTFHNLAVARDLLDSGLPVSDVQRQLGVHSFVAEKTTRQARDWTIEQLEAALRGLLATDQALKTGAADPEVALELFLARSS